MSIIESNIWGAAKDEINKNALNKNGDTFLGELNMNGNPLTNISTPQNDTDAVNMQWVKNWQPPWTYTNEFPHDNLFPNRVRVIRGSIDKEKGSITLTSDKIYIINSGSILLKGEIYFSSNPGKYFAGSVEVYRNESIVSSYVIKEGQLSSVKNVYDKIFEEVIDVNKGDIIRFKINGNYSSSSTGYFDVHLSSYVDIGNPYKYSSFDSAIISSGE